MMGIVMMTLAIVGIIEVATLTAQQSFGISMPTLQRGTASSDDGGPKAPIAVSEDNVYLVWWTNKTGNWEVMFRASNDGGATFANKINLSNTTDANSENAEIAASGNSVFVSWWENSLQNTTSESILRISNDAGATFGPIILLGQNGTVSNPEE